EGVGGLWCHEMRDELGCPGTRDQSPPTRLPFQGMRTEPAAIAGGGDRSLPDPLAPREQRTGLGTIVAGDGRSAKARQGPLDRRLQPQRGADEAAGTGCPDHFRSAALLVAASQGRSRRAAVLRRTRDRNGHLFTDAVRNVDRSDDQATRGGFAGGRLAQAKSRISGAEAIEEPPVGGTNASGRRALWPQSRRSGGRVGVATTGGDRSDRGGEKCQTGTRGDGRR